MTPIAAANSTFGGVHDFFNSGTWTVMRTLLILILIVFWLAIGYWVYKDARRRTEDQWYVTMATVLGVVPPFFGALVYMLFRPPEYLEDVRERELEIRAMEERLSHGDQRCPVCRAEVDSTFLVCPVCTTRLKQPCTSCNAPLEASWRVCPYCETPVEPPQLEVPTLAARPRKRRRPAEPKAEPKAQ